MDIKRNKHFNRSVPVCVADIYKSAENVVKDQQFRKPLPGDKDAVLEGHFSVTDCPSGLIIHCNDTTSVCDFEASFVAPAGMTVTILLNGIPDIELDGEPISFDDALFVDGATAILWTSNQPVKVMRRVRKHERIRKISISLGNDWIENWQKADVRPSSGVRDVLDSPGRQIQLKPSERMILNAIELMKGDQRNSMVGKLCAEGCAIDVLREVFSILEDTPEPATVPASENSQARKVQIFIEENFSQELTLSQISSSVGMSISSMQRVFKRSFGMTVAAAIRHLRLENARSALVFDGVSVAQASRMAGYQSASNFTNAFFKEFGVLPSHTKA